MSLASAIAEIQALMGALTGIAGAPDYPPVNITDFPFIVCYPKSGIIRGSTPLGQVLSLHDIQLDLHVVRNGLQANLQSVYDYVELIPHTIYNNLESFTALDTPGPITGSLAFMTWQKTRTIGLSYNIGQVAIAKSEAFPA